MTNITSNAKSNKSGNAAGLPPRPYTEYTIFFRLERTYLLQSTGIIDDEVLQSLDPNHNDPIEFPRPARYQNLALSPYWYSSSHKKAIEKKRKHRKRQGRMDLKTLSKTISASWRNCERDIVEYCKKLAQAELTKYNAIVCSVKAKQEAAGKAANPVHSNGALSHEDLIVQPSKPQVQAQAQAAGSMPMPVITPSVTPFMNDMRKNFNKVMGYGQINEGQNNDPALLKMQLFQHLEASVGMGNISSNCASSTSSLNTNYHPVSSTSRGNVSRPAIPEKKRKFVRRVSAPPEFADIKPYMGPNTNSNFGMNSTDFLCGNIESNANVISSVLGEPAQDTRRRASITSSMPIHEDQMLKQMQRPSTTSSMPGPTGQSMFCGNTESNANVFMGEESSVQTNPAKKMRRRASMTSVPTRADQQALKKTRRPSMTSSMTRQALSSSFTMQLQRGSFTCVPDWKEGDADMLLDMLNEPEVSDDVLELGSDDFVLSSYDQEFVNMFTKQQNFDDFLNASELGEQIS